MVIFIIPIALALLMFSPHAAVPPKQAGCVVGNDLSRGVALYHTTCVTNSKGESHEIILY